MMEGMTIDIEAAVESQRLRDLQAALKAARLVQIGVNLKEIQARIEARLEVVGMKY